MMEPECKYESEETKDGIPIVSVERTESGYWRARKGDVEEVGDNAVRALVNLSRLCRDEAEELEDAACVAEQMAKELR